MRLQRLYSSLCVVMIISLTTACLDPYESPVSKAETNFLVIDGVLNSTDNIATVKLSRAIHLKDSAYYPKVGGAIIKVEDENNNDFMLTEESIGVYSAKHILNPNLRYRTRITVDGKVYRSDFIKLINSNKVDSLSWTYDNSNVEILVSSQDLSAGAKYYRYSFEETYEYTAPLYSIYKYENGTVSPRMDNIYQCWLTQQSNSILVASTENFTQNIISKFLVQKIKKGDRRLWHRYSILLKQYPLNQESYDYWFQLKKITESMGGLFDPIPFKLKGNIVCDTNPDETVLGYFYGGNISTKRIIIDGRQLPPDYNSIERTDCKEYDVLLRDLNTLQGRNVILTVSKIEFTTVVGYYYTTPICADCREQGGTNVKPDFM